MARCKDPWTCHNLTICTTTFEPIARKGRLVQKFDRDVFKEASGVLLHGNMQRILYVSCNNLVILVGSSDECNYWVLDFFTKLDANNLGSLTLKKNPAIGYETKFSLSDAAFGAVCSWIKTKGDKLKRLIFEEVKYSE